MTIEIKNYKGKFNIMYKDGEYIAEDQDLHIYHQIKTLIGAQDKVLCIGLGFGVAQRLFKTAYPDLVLHTVEIEQDVINHYDNSGELAHTITKADILNFTTNKRFDVIYIDVAKNITRRALPLLFKVLAEDGKIILFNWFGLDLSDYVHAVKHIPVKINNKYFRGPISIITGKK